MVYIWVSVTLTGEGDTPYIKLFGCRERGYLNLAAKVTWPDQKPTREPHTDTVNVSLCLSAVVTSVATDVCACVCVFVYVRPRILISFQRNKRRTLVE